MAAVGYSYWVRRTTPITVPGPSTTKVVTVTPKCDECPTCPTCEKCATCPDCPVCPSCPPPACPNDLAAPVVSAVSPTDEDTNVAVSPLIVATFETDMAPSSLNTSTVLLADGDGNPVEVLVGYCVVGKNLEIKPLSSLAYSTTYTVTLVSGCSGVTTLAGGVLSSDYVWSFTTQAQMCGPYSILPNDGVPDGFESSGSDAEELGVRFYPTVDGEIRGLRFYRSPNDLGGNTGHLWAEDGTLLGSVDFPFSPSEGWVTGEFDSPIPVSANVIYIASYHTSGGYSYSPFYFAEADVMGTGLVAPRDGTTGGSNGIYCSGSVPCAPTNNNTFHSNNYWADVLFWTNQIC